MVEREDFNIVEKVTGSKDSSKKPAGVRLCFVCEENKAEYCIKGEPEDAYCKDCAIDAFGDLDCVVKL